MGYLLLCMVNICLGHFRHGKKKLKSSMLISSLHNDDLLICMPQNNNNNKITNSLKKEIHIFEFCGL